MSVPFLDLKSQHRQIQDKLMAALQRVVESGTFILGPEVAQLETEVAAYCRARHAVGVSSGTDALLVTLMAMGVGSGDEVVTTPFTFFATVGSIVRTGAKPAFVDIDPETDNLDPSRLERAITPRTKVIMPVHLFGQCADMGPIMETAAKKHVAVIEDAAQAIGTEYKDGRRAGSIGAAGCLSFYPSKNLGALGDGGMVVTDEASLAERIRLLRGHGAKPKYVHRFIGGNFRLDELQAAILRVKLEYLDEWTRQRRENAGRYASLFHARGLDRIPQIHVPKRAYDTAEVPHAHIFNQFVIKVADRDRLRDFLKQRGIGTEVYYPLPLHLQESLNYLGYRKGDFPNAEKAVMETVALPIYPELTAAQQEEVVDRIKEFYKP